MGQLGQLLSNLVSGFLLLRDFFGYLLPGSVFVGGLFYSMKTSDLQLIPGLPNWIIVIVGSYLCGNIMAAFGYTIIEKIIDKCYPIEKPITELYDCEFLYYRNLYPELYHEVDRQDTVNILRITLAISLIFTAGTLGVFQIFSLWEGSWNFHIGVISIISLTIIGVGLFLFSNTHSLINLVKTDMRKATIMAAKTMEKNYPCVDAKCKIRRGSQVFE
jgi:hypothetical protein